MKNTLYRTIAVLILYLPTAVSAEGSGNRQCAALFDDIWHMVAAASQPFLILSDKATPAQQQKHQQA